MLVAAVVRLHDLEDERAEDGVEVAGLLRLPAAGAESPHAANECHEHAQQEQREPNRGQQPHPEQPVGGDGDETHGGQGGGNGGLG